VEKKRLKKEIKNKFELNFYCIFKPFFQLTVLITILNSIQRRNSNDKKS
jgi:hypothetical protein